ncbi:MAG: hypothetical protein ACREJ3_11715, partial [Polyangiaceae bacterium]
MPLYRPLALSAVAVALCLATPGRARSAPEASPVTPSRFTDEAPDAMLGDALARAQAPKASLHARLSALATIATLSTRASDGLAQRAFERIAGDARIGA